MSEDRPFVEGITVDAPEAVDLDDALWAIPGSEHGTSWEEEVFLALRWVEEDPNRDPDLCAACAEEYVALW